MGAKIIRETIVAGKTVMQAYRATTRIKTEKDKKRKRRCDPTPEAMAKVNHRNAERMLTAKINHNFEPGDLHLTLTYASVPTNEEAKKHLQKFLRNLRNHCARNGIVLKWIAVTEYKHQRIHHHVVMTGIELETITSYWKCGWVNAKTLDSSGNYEKLAKYLIKETGETFREADAAAKRRYTCSRTIVTPQIRREIVSERELRHDPKPLKGYYIPQDSIRRYEHAILGVGCMEFIQVSLTPEPRLKRWYRGKSVRPEKHYKTEYDEQLSMIDELSFE